MDGQNYMASRIDTGMDNWIVVGEEYRKRERISPMRTSELIKQLYTAILIHPQDNTSRWAFADALDEDAQESPEYHPCPVCEGGGNVGESLKCGICEGSGRTDRKDERREEWAELIRLQLKRIQHKSSRDARREDTLRDVVLRLSSDSLKGCTVTDVTRGFVSGVSTFSGDFLKDELINRLFLGWPIEKVTLSDKIPYHPIMYGMNSNAVYHSRDDIPEEVLDIMVELSGEMKAYAATNHQLPYIVLGYQDSPYKDAVKAMKVLLSDALVVYGRRKVGLPVDVGVFKNNKSLFQKPARKSRVKSEG